MKIRSYFTITTIILLLSISLPLYAQDKDKKTPLKNEIIIRVGNRTISKTEFDEMVRSISKKRRKKPDTHEITALADQMAEQMLFAEGARAAGIDKEKDVQLLIEETVDKLLASLYVRKIAAAEVKVSEGDVNEFYNKNKSKWKQPEMVRAAHILLRTDKLDTPEAVNDIKKKAEEIKARITSGEDFNTLVIKYSEDTGTKDNNGDLGFFDRNGKIKAITNKAFSMAPGEISEPVKTSVGFHIIKLIERRAAGFKPVDEVKSEIRSMLYRQKRLDAVKAERKRLEKLMNFYVIDSYSAEGNQ